MENAVYEALGDSHEKLGEIKKLFALCWSPFETIMTEHGAFRRFQELKTFIPPQSVTVGFRDEFRKHKTHVFDNDDDRHDSNVDNLKFAFPLSLIHISEPTRPY